MTARDRMLADVAAAGLEAAQTYRFRAVSARVRSRRLLRTALTTRVGRAQRAQMLARSRSLLRFAGALDRLAWDLEHRYTPRGTL